MTVQVRNEQNCVRIVEKCDRCFGGLENGILPDEAISTERNWSGKGLMFMRSS